jgi:integrase
MPEQSDIYDVLHDTYRGASKTLYVQAVKAVDTITLYAGNEVLPSEVTLQHVKGATARWYSEGLSPATITKRLNCLGKMGVNVTGTKPTKKPTLKWWLKPQQQAELLAHPDIPQDLKDWVIWTTTTGLRIEETLRLNKNDFVIEGIDFLAVTVPGLKTMASQATLPLALEAQLVVQRRMLAAVGRTSWNPLANPQLFELDYQTELVPMWDEAMRLLGVDKQLHPTATLKALRRNAARYLHVDRKMPLDMVRQYLRHEDIKTTMGYLALTGGYGTEEMKGYL